MILGNGEGGWGGARAVALRKSVFIWLYLVTWGGVEGSGVVAAGVFLGAALLRKIHLCFITEKQRQDVRHKRTHQGEVTHPCNLFKNF